VMAGKSRRSFSGCGRCAGTAEGRFGERVSSRVPQVSSRVSCAVTRRTLLSGGHAALMFGAVATGQPAAAFAQGFSIEAGRVRQRHTPQPGAPIIDALLLEGASFPVDAFLKQVATARITGKAVSGVKRHDGGVFSFEVGDEFLALVLMPAPYPAKDLEGPLATSWLWPPQPPIETVTRHRSHLLITMTGGSADPVRRRLVLTAVTALAAGQPGVMAVYWGDAGLIIYPPLFIDMARIGSPAAPPLYLWVDLHAFRNQDGTTGLATTGLSSLGHMEIEIPRVDMAPGDLREWLLNVMYDLLKNGPVLKDGQTIGMSAEHKLRIRHVPSSFGHPGKVIRLEPS